MENKNIDTLKSFDLENIPDLEVAVMGALELFQSVEIPKLKTDGYRRPLVVGSGNAEATGKIIFRDMDAIFASESNFEDKLKSIKDIDGVVLISASGEKHAPIIAKKAKELGKRVTLITNTPNSSAKKELDLGQDEEFVFPKNREPYTYNTSTYLGMILAYTGEDPKKLYDFILNKVATMDFSKMGEFEKFYMIVPNQFSEVIRMLHVKFIELFGRNIARDIETSEYVPHATTVNPTKELFISFGSENKTWGEPENRMTIPMPEDANYGAMMVVGYFVVSQIQKRHKQYFKENIAEYVKQVSEVFGHELKAIVE